MKSKVSLINITIVGIATALIIGAQVSLSFIPNVELVTLLIILFTLHFHKRTIYIIYIFAIVECLIYPFGLWCIVYFYIWTILYFLVCIFKESTSALFWAVLGAIYGLLFGTLSSIPSFFTLGFVGGISSIIAGLSFDFIHCFGNFIVILCLFKPLNNLLGKIHFFTTLS